MLDVHSGADRGGSNTTPGAARRRWRTASITRLETDRELIAFLWSTTAEVASSITLKWMSNSVPAGNAATLRNSSSRPVPFSSVVIDCGESLAQGQPGRSCSCRPRRVYRALEQVARVGCEVAHPGVEMDDVMVVIGLPELHETEPLAAQDDLQIEGGRFRSPGAGAGRASGGGGGGLGSQVIGAGREQDEGCARPAHGKLGCFGILMSSMHGEIAAARRSWGPAWRQPWSASRRKRGPVALRPRLSPGVPLSRDCQL